MDQNSIGNVIYVRQPHSRVTLVFIVKRNWFIYARVYSTTFDARRQRFAPAWIVAHGELRVLAHRLLRIERFIIVFVWLIVGLLLEVLIVED